MAPIKLLFGMMLSLLCLHLALVAGSPMRPPEGKFTPTSPGDFEITPMVERAIPLTASVGSPPSAFFTYGSHSAKMTHGPHTAPPHSAHSTHPLHTPHSTDGSHSAKSTHGSHSAHFTHGSHSAHFTRPDGHLNWAEDSDGPKPTLSGSVPHFLSTNEWWKREDRKKTTTPFTFNPSTLPTMSTITLATGTECITTMYLPHYPPIGPKTTTVWTSTSTLYPEFDCHGCVILTTVDPWTMGQPTTHYHHTKTTKSVLTVESPVCKPTSTL
jgi:hypothetical protein